MSHRYLTTLLIVTFAIQFFCQNTCQSQSVPPKISFQALLTDMAGSELLKNGNYEVFFQLFDDLNDGTSVYDETLSDVNVENGLVEFYIGTEEGDSLLNLPFDHQYFAEVTLRKDNNEFKLQKRIPLSTVPYAMRAERVHQALEDHYNVEGNPHENDLLIYKNGKWRPVSMNAKDGEALVWNGTTWDTRSIGSPVGTVIAWTGVDPTVLEIEGWLVCNGELFSESLYPKLKEVLKTNRLPDLYGKFLRGIDHRGNTDPDGKRPPGHLQEDAIIYHEHFDRHRVWAFAEGGRDLGDQGLYDDYGSTPDRTRIFDWAILNNNGIQLTNTELQTEGPVEPYQWNNGNPIVNQPLQKSNNQETRPINVAVWYLIKAK